MLLNKPLAMWFHVIGIFGSGSLCFEYTDRLLECYAQHCGVRETCVANKSLCVYLRGGSRRRCSQFQIDPVITSWVTKTNSPGKAAHQGGPPFLERQNSLSFPQRVSTTAFRSAERDNIPHCTPNHVKAEWKCLKKPTLHKYEGAQTVTG